MTFDELLRNYTCEEGLQPTQSEGERKGILDWEIVKISRSILDPSNTRGLREHEGQFFYSIGTQVPFEDWLRSNIQDGDWEFIRHPYYVAFRNYDDAMMFALAWGIETGPK